MFENIILKRKMGVFQIGPAGAPAKHGIYPLDFFVVFAKNFVFPLRLFFTAKHAKCYAKGRKAGLKGYI
jgi:hypothetical protein